MAKLKIPTPLRPYLDGQTEIAVQGRTVAEALADLRTRYPQVERHLFNPEGELHPFINLFLGEENIVDLEGTETPLKDSDRLVLIPSIAGG